MLAACDLGGPPATDSSRAPIVTRVTWDAGDRDVAVDDGPVSVWAPLDVWFDRFLEPDSVTSGTVRLESNEQVVRATVTYDVLDRRVRLTPSRSLDPNLAYTLVVTVDVHALGSDAGRQDRRPLTTGDGSDDPPADRPPIGWGEAETVIGTRCESSTCHGDDETAATCGAPAPWLVALGLELDAPESILATAIDVPAHQWPRFSRIDPGRPDRSYVTYKLVDFAEEIVTGNLMPTVSERGGGVEANGDASPGACCALEDLPLLHPPPWAEPTGRYDPEALRKRSLAYRTPTVWACACADTRGRFAPPTGACGVAEGDCGNGADDDGDALEDCADPDCHFADECPHEVSCDDLDGGGAPVDEDGDGVANCADPDCAAAPVCEGVAGTPAVEAACDDGIDDDGDGAIDCADFDCSFATPCLAGLEAPDPEPVSYCRGRAVSDWILAGAPLGPERDTCERACAVRCDAAATFADCRDACLSTVFDGPVAACVRDALCGAPGGVLPRPDGAGRLRLAGQGCAATCDGPTVAACAATGAGASTECAPTCAELCAPLAELCAPLAACGLGGS